MEIFATCTHGVQCSGNSRTWGEVGRMGGGWGLLVLIEPTPVTMLRHYATILALQCNRCNENVGDLQWIGPTHATMQWPGGEVCETHWWHPESTKVFTAPPPPLPPPPIVIFIYPYKGSEVASLSPKQISTGSLHGAACLVTDSYFIR